MGRRRKKSTTIPGLVVFVVVLSVFVILPAFLAILSSPLGLIVSACLIAVALGYGRLVAAQQAERAQRWRDLDQLRSMSGTEFERHVADTYRKMGYKAELTRASGDQGADVIASKNGERIAIQCKQWAGAVGNDAVQQAFSGKGFYDCLQAAVICTTDFTHAAKDLARKNGVQLLNGNDYIALVGRIASEQRLESSATPLFPRGRPLAIESGLAGIAILFLVIHFSSASSTPPSSQKGALSTEVPVATGLHQAGATYTSIPATAVLAAPTVVPSPTATNASTMTPTATIMVKVGNTGGIGVYLRHTPHLDDRWVAWPDGTELVVLEGAIESDGTNWLKVRDPDGQEGWIPSQYAVR